VVERAVAPFFRDSGLYPVTAVVVAHVVLAIAVLLLDVVRTPGPFSIAALGALALATLEVARRGLARRRLGPLGATLLASWLLGALAAWGADRAGLY
jgi:hypothetical protein